MFGPRKEIAPKEATVEGKVIATNNRISTLRSILDRFAPDQIPNTAEVERLLVE